MAILHCECDAVGSVRLESEQGYGMGHAIIIKMPFPDRCAIVHGYADARSNICGQLQNTRKRGIGCSCHTGPGDERERSDRSYTQETGADSRKKDRATNKRKQTVRDGFHEVSTKTRPLPVGLRDVAMLPYLSVVCRPQSGRSVFSMSMLL